MLTDDLGNKTYEIPFWPRSLNSGDSQPKWISGVGKLTTVGDIVKVLIRAEGWLDGLPSQADKDSLCENYTLVENWRGVEKPLSRSSRILKIWTAWGDESSRVKFVLKRLKVKEQSASIKPKDFRTTTPNRLKRRGSTRSNASSHASFSKTFHPKRLLDLSAPSFASPGPQDQSLTEGQDLEELMRVIVNRGKRLQNKLNKLEDGKTLSKSTNDLQLPNRRRNLPLTPPVSASSILLSGAGAGNLGLPIGGAAAPAFKTSSSLTDLNKSYLNQRNSTTPSPSFQAFEVELKRLAELNDRLHDAESKLNVLSQAYRNINAHTTQFYESKQRGELLATLHSLSTAKESNSEAELRIDKNRRLINEMQKSFEEKKSAIKRLEYDVNVIEKESRKLGKEYDKVVKLEIPQIPSSNSLSDLNDSQAIYKELKELQLECRRFRDMENQKPKILTSGSLTAGPSVALRLDCAGSPGGSTSSGVSSERPESPSHQTFRKESSGKKKGLENVAEEEQISSTTRDLEEGDANSDTGLSSLHSSTAGSGGEENEQSLQQSLLDKSQQEFTLEFGTLV